MKVEENWGGVVPWKKEKGKEAQKGAQPEYKDGQETTGFGLQKNLGGLARAVLSRF